MSKRERWNKQILEVPHNVRGNKHITDAKNQNPNNLPLFSIHITADNSTKTTKNYTVQKYDALIAAYVCTSPSKDIKNKTISVH